MLDPEGVEEASSEAGNLADAIIAAGWRPRQEWLMGAGATGSELIAVYSDMRFEIVVQSEIPLARWRPFVGGLTYAQANAIVVEHNR